MSIKHFREEFLKEGFRHIYEWRDEADVVYPEHAHEDMVSFIVLQGSIYITFSDKNNTIEVKKGERFDVPPGKVHSAYAGPEGCSYLVAEMIEGDA